jgi:hypothetical protein
VLRILYCENMQVKKKKKINVTLGAHTQDYIRNLKCVKIKWLIHSKKIFHNLYYFGIELSSEVSDVAREGRDFTLYMHSVAICAKVSCTGELPAIKL